MNNLKSFLFSDFNFTPLNREYNIPIKSSRNFKVKDIHFSFYTKPTLDPMVSNYAFIAPNDIRVYVNEKNITEFVLLEILEELRKVPKEELINSYQSGAKDYIKLADKLTTDRERLSKDLEIKDSYLDNTDWLERIQLISDRSFGGSGNLHPCSFLYRYINIKELSLNSILKRANLSFDDVFANESLVITFSMGPAPSKEEFNPQSDITNGKLFLSLHVETLNPLEKELRKIYEKLKNIVRVLDKIRIDYLTPIYSLTQKNSQEIETSNESTINSLKEIDESINNLG